MVDFFITAAKISVLGAVMGIGGYALLSLLMWIFDLME